MKFVANCTYEVEEVDGIEDVEHCTYEVEEVDGIEDVEEVRNCRINNDTT